MFQSLFGQLVSAQVIALGVGRGGGTVRVRGQFVEFSSSLVRIVWHSVRTLAAILEHFGFHTVHFRHTAVLSIPIARMKTEIKMARVFTTRQTNAWPMLYLQQVLLFA